jgi:hypothetical protein
VTVVDRQVAARVAARFAAKPIKVERYHHPERTVRDRKFPVGSNIYVTVPFNDEWRIWAKTVGSWDGVNKAWVFGDHPKTIELMLAKIEEVFGVKAEVKDVRSV